MFFYTITSTFIQGVCEEEDVKLERRVLEVIPSKKTVPTTKHLKHHRVAVIQSLRVDTNFDYVVLKTINL